MTPTVSGGRQSGVLEGEAEGVSGSGEGFWTNDVWFVWFILRKLACIHDLISARQLVRVEWAVMVMDFVELDITGMAVEVEAMTAYDVTKGGSM